MPTLWPGGIAARGRFADGRQDLATSRPPQPRQRAGRRASSRAEIDAFLAQGEGLGPATGAGPARPADLCARRHHEPAAALGHRLPAAGRHVPRGGRDRRARRAARLLPRPRRMPRLALGVAGRAARRADGRDRLPRRPHPDRQGPRARAPRDRSAEGAGAGVRRRRHGGADRRSLRRRRASSACSACRPSCSRKATTRSPSRRSARSRG